MVTANACRVRRNTTHFPTMTTALLLFPTLRYARVPRAPSARRRRDWFRVSIHRLALAASLLATLAADADTHVAPDDKRLQYTGRIDFANPTAPQLSWPGTTLTANFTGESLALELDDLQGRNFFNVLLDDDFAHPIVLRCERGAKTYAVAAHLGPGRHRFLLTKRTEGAEGATVFKGLDLADGARLLPPPPRPRHKMEIFGDSISSGMGNEGPDGSTDGDPQYKNNFLAYGPMAARDLHAELHVISQSGIGIMISWFDFTMPQFYDQLSAVGNNDTHWDFTQWTPELVVINLLQNDSWLIDREKRLIPAPTDAQRIQAYVDFLRTIRSKYPKAYILCTLGSMDATRPGSKWPGYISSAVDQLKKETPGERIDTLFFDFTGYEAHPRVSQHRANAAKLTAFVRAKLGW
jgi:hypothetical protein